MNQEMAETLVRTGPGTRMGNLMRRYWVPVLMSREVANPDGPQVARKSQHMEGKALDLRLIDVSLTGLHALALSLQGGGVGFYPDSDFIHVDVGPVRTWQGS